MSKSKKNSIYPEKKAKKVREKFNWKPYVVIAAVIVVIFGGIFAKVYLLDGFFAVVKQVKFEPVSGAGYYDAKNQITYLPAPSYYEPASIVMEPTYGRIGSVSLFKPGQWENVAHLYALCYPIGDLSDKNYEKVNPDGWLATDENHGFTVYYNEKYTPPKPWDLKYDTAYICTAGGNIEVQELHEDHTYELMNEFFDEKSENLFDTVYPVSNYLYQVRVTSTNYSWLHLVLNLYTYEGEFYLYLPEMARFVKVNSEISALYFDDFLK